MILHCISHHPSGSKLKACLEYIAANDVLILFSQGIYAASPPYQTLLKDILGKNAIYALKPDLSTCRLLTKINTEIQIIDYAEFVDLTLNFSKIINW